MLKLIAGMLKLFVALLIMLEIPILKDWLLQQIR